MMEMIRIYDGNEIASQNNGDWLIIQICNVCVVLHSQIWLCKEPELEGQIVETATTAWNPSHCVLSATYCSIGKFPVKIVFAEKK